MYSCFNYINRIGFVLSIILLLIIDLIIELISILKIDKLDNHGCNKLIYFVKSCLIHY